MGSSRTRTRTHVPCIGRRILNHCATREVPRFYLLTYLLPASTSPPPIWKVGSVTAGISSLFHFGLESLTVHSFHLPSSIVCGPAVHQAGETAKNRPCPRVQHPRHYPAMSALKAPCASGALVPSRCLSPKTAGSVQTHSRSTAVCRAPAPTSREDRSSHPEDAGSWSVPGEGSQERPGNYWTG